MEKLGNENVTRLTVIVESLKPWLQLKAFAGELERLDTHGTHADLVDQAKSLTADHPDVAETALLLWESLMGFAPKYCYFGPHPSTPERFGFWPAKGSIDYHEPF